jgi:cell division protein FtsQ
MRTPSDKRFRRAYVKPTRRRRWRAFALPLTKYLVLAAAGGYGLYRGGIVAVNARVLRIDRIVVGGNKRLSNGEVLSVLEGLRGENLIWADLGAWQHRLLASPWVKDAALRRSLPSTVEVVVSEREPIGIARLQGGLYLVDEQGMVIDQYGPQYADLDLPIIDGLSGRGDSASASDVPRAELAARLLAALAADKTVARKLSQVDVSDPHNAAVILSGDAAVIYVGEDRFLPRLQSYLDLAAALRERVAGIDYVDVRFDDRIYVRPAGKTGKSGAIAVPTGQR